MTNTPSKHILIPIVLLIILTIGYYQFYAPDSTDNNRNITDTKIVSSERIETDSVKRLETVAHSGTDWGMSPFGSGKPLTEVEENTPKFKKPDTKWEARTINGITYRFGEGNPKEVELSPEEIRDLQSKGYGYISPKAEYALKNLLESDDFIHILNKCSDLLDIGNLDTTKNNWEKWPPNLDMETMLIIDPETKRKDINNIYLAIIEPAFSYLVSPVVDQNNPFRTCIGDDFPMAIRAIGKMDTVTRSYMKGE
jgi:hypothetical protein